MASSSKSPPVRSMTGFSRVSFGGHGIELDVEVRSVNHRFLDVLVKGPRCYSAIERDIKNLVQKQHRRGRIEISISRRSIGEGGENDSVPASLDRQVKLYGAACRRYGVSTDALGTFIGQLLLREGYGVDDDSEVPEEEFPVILRVVDEASEALCVMREREGDGLVSDISKRLANLQECLARIERLRASSPHKLREKLHERLKLIAPEVKVDEQRFAAEVAFLCDRIDVSEEISRIGIHVAGFRNALKGDPDGVGRKLDFLTQELGREFNTIGSKAQDGEVQGLVVEAKAELEKIREQVQNIE